MKGRTVAQSLETAPLTAALMGAGTGVGVSTVPLAAGAAPVVGPAMASTGVGAAGLLAKVTGAGKGAAALGQEKSVTAAIGASSGAKVALASALAGASAKRVAILAALL
ncbi:hypothetical protein FRC20_004332 [Serendipita sp. 405]|nr:hypothetical protein FRC20_004332 [Serendipita sp. 405]